MQSYEIRYNVDSKNSSGLTAYLRRNRNSVSDVTQVVSAEVVLITKENLANDTAGGLEFTANGHLTSTLSFGLSGDLFHDEIDATALAASSTIGSVTIARAKPTRWRIPPDSSRG
jgi:hypothetical protein